MMRYFFKFDTDGSVVNWQVAETDATTDKLIADGYIEVTRVRYLAHWRDLDYWQVHAMWPAHLHERTV